MFELLRLAWGALWERRGRTIGAVVGITIAFTALTFALGLGNAFKQSTLSFFEGLGINNVFLLGQEFTDADVALVRAYAAPYASAVVPISAAPAAVRLPDGRVEEVTLYGVPPSDISYVVPSSAVLEGQGLIGGGLAVVGYYVAFNQNTGQQELYPGYPLVLELNKRSYTLVVSGVMSPEHPGVISTTSGVLVSIDQFRAVTGLNTYQIVIISLRDTRYIDTVQSLLKPLFPNAEVLTLTSLVETVNQFFTGLELFLGLVSGVSTVITALWLYDTMTISAI
ncbi:MAG: ABC transporter permease, partial [Thermoproteus sp. AZ2]